MDDRTRYNITAKVLAEVMAERVAQDYLWGVQDFPWHWRGDGRGVALTGRSYAAWAELYKAECDRRRRHVELGSNDSRSYALVLLEEVFEALAQTDPAKVRAELVQVAAVAVKAIEALDRAHPSGAPLADDPDWNSPEDAVYDSGPVHDHGDGPRPCLCGGTGQAARCTTPETHNWGCECPSYTTCTAEGCTPDYCPGGKQCVAIAPDEPGWVPTDAMKEELSGKLTDFKRELLAAGADPVDPFAPESRIARHVADADGPEGECGCGLPNDHERHIALPVATGTPIPPVPDGGPDDWPTYRHPCNGAGRLHGICRRGEDRDAPVHGTEGSDG